MPARPRDPAKEHMHNAKYYQRHRSEIGAKRSQYYQKNKATILKRQKERRAKAKAAALANPPQDTPPQVLSDHELTEVAEEVANLPQLPLHVTVGPFKVTLSWA
ncbi:MAG: hypothetical protein CMM02_07605 [Rhodopirellula sp.]|nr:hypothetical protein [Rhodopirellula sp.]|tara:strand:- start:314 stop:625 length:312 start_codon:yes stop_codon:yes gene_type:complete